MNCIKTIWNLWNLKRNEKKSAAKISALQDKKLKRLLHYAYEHSSYYRDSFERAGITAADIDSMPLSAFPVMDKSVLMSRFEEIVTVPGLTQEEIGRFDERETVSGKLFLEKYHIVHSSGAMAVGDGVNGVGAKQMYLDINQPVEEWIQAIRAFQPNMVIGYPSAVKILAELICKGSLSLNVFRIVTCGEPLGASLRRYLEDMFGAEVINFYGASESLAMGVESSLQEGLLLFDDMNIIEVWDGAMYLTCLYNFAQPLIRYRLSDRLTLQAPGDDSRYPFTRAIGLLGRNEDILWFRDGNGRQEFLHPLAVEGFCIRGLCDYQFWQISSDTFEMLAEVPDDTLQENVRREILRQMKEILSEKGLEYVQFFVRFVPEILPDPRTGKKRLILSCEEENI